MEKYLQSILDEWEEGIYIRNMKRMYKTSKNYKNPRKEAYEDFRHHRITKWIYHHECQFVRKQTNKRLRRTLRRELCNEVYYKVVAHDYKTYGWNTW